MCIQYDKKTQRVSLVIRNGDKVIVVELGGKVREMTKEERKKGDHRPEK